MKPFIPNTQTVNPDRKYFTDGDYFIKHDSVINRGVNEAEKLRVLNHKHIQKYVTSGIRGTVHVLETVLFDGETLENVALTTSDIVAVKSQLLGVVSYLTTRGVIHGDINVSNVLWNGTDILLIDWESGVFCDGDQRIVTNVDIVGKHPHSGVLNTIKAIKRA